MSVKRHLKIIFPLLVLTGFILVACSAPARLPVLGQDDVVVAFGDSITFGTGAETQESYPAYLEQMIGRRVVNAGVPGEVTATGLSRLEAVLDREKPVIIIICHGGNDYLRRLKHRQVADNIRAMVRLSRLKGVAVVLIAVPSLGLSVRPAPLYRDVAKELIVPLEEKTLSSILSDRTLKSDIIHPNAAGYRLLAESVASLLKKSGAID